MVIDTSAALKRLWLGKCTIKKRGQYTDPITKINNFIEFDAVIDEPCRLSYGSAPTTNVTDTRSEITQTIKLFIRPDLDIKEGSHILVTQNGRTIEYKASGTPKVYSSHQEIELSLWGDA